MQSGQDAIIKFKSPQKPSPVWIATFASKVVGLGVSYEVDSQVIWEQPPKHCAIYGRRGRLRLVVETLDQSNWNPQSPSPSSDSKDYQLLRSAVKGIELNLERQEARLQSSSRISPKVVVDKILEGFFHGSSQQGEIMQCIGKAAYYLSRQPALWLVPGPSTEQYLFTKNGTRAALVMLGAGSHDLDLWEAESESEAYHGAARIGRGRETLEERLLFGTPFALAFEEIYASYAQGVPDDQKPRDKGVYSLPAWSKYCLETIRRVLALWTVLAFAQPIDQHEISIDGRAAYQLIERSDGTFSAFGSMWRIAQTGLAMRGLATRGYVLQFSAVQEMTFEIIGGRLDANHSSNANTAGVTNGGTFVAMSTLLEPDREISNVAITFVGQGGIFLNQQATSLLQSIDSSDEENQGFKISSELLKFSRCEHNPKFETLMDSVNDPTQTPLERSLYVTERSDTVSLAWSLTGRHCSDILVDVLLCPHRILRAVLAIQYIDQFGKLHGLPLSDRTLGLLEQPRYPCKVPLKAINLENFLTSGPDITSRRRLEPVESKDLITLVMMQGNSCARLLALVYWPHSEPVKRDSWFDLQGLSGRSKNRPHYICSSEQLEYCLPWFPNGTFVAVC